MRPSRFQSVSPWRTKWRIGTGENVAIPSARAAELPPRGAEARRPAPGPHPANRRAAGRRAPGRQDRAAPADAARAPRRRDALGADDRREREPRHLDALPEVPAPRGLPRGAARGARARHLPHRLLPPEGALAPRDDTDADRGVRRRGAAADGGPPPPPRGGAEDGERRRGRAREPAGDRRRHARAAALAAARDDAPRRP